MSTDSSATSKLTIPQCPLCHDLLKEATTISDCLHTFCRNCITKTLTNGEIECYCCPVCSIDLGTAPLQKLRLVKEDGNANTCNSIVANNNGDRLISGRSRTKPVWFSLIPVNDQNMEAPRTQLSRRYLRIEDGNVPASFILKYLQLKLNLTDESEVDIFCRGQPVDLTMTLHDVLLHMWLGTRSSRTIRVTVGSSAEKFVMVINYRLKAPSS